ncbi:MAG: redoxin domain-containing protein [Chloroflexi bacterium]|nr:redoxin domain-containing protein [Chloroflexota bacterium]
MPGIIRCPSCGQEIDSNSRFCIHCTARICPGCHGPVPPRAVYCPHCGFAVGPAMPGAAEQQPPTPPPPPRPLPSSQGGIIGPQPRQQPPYPQTPSTPMPGAVPQAPVPQPIPPRQYGTDGQPPGASGSPGAMPYVSAQQPSVSTQKTFVDTGPIRVRRFPTALVAILIIAIIGLLGFATFKAGWLEAPLSTVQEFVSGIKLPQWLPISPKDTTPPTIQNVSVSNITMTGAVITWQTDEPATSQVMICDPGGGCTWTELDENLVTNHSVSLIDLKPNTAYHFTATSTDAKENQAIAEGDLTTSAQTTATPLTISGVKVSNITDSNTTITWQTDKPATSQVEYGTTNAYGSTTTLDQNLTASHSAILAGLKPNTTYHFKVKSKDASGNEATFQDQTFTTRSTVSAAAEVGPEVGKLAPDFTLPTLDGKQVSLSEFRGKIVMINFWQNVQQCRTELDYIQAVYDKWPQDKLAILAVSWKQTPQDVQSFLNSKPLTLPILIDETGEVAEKYDVLRSPVSLFIDAQGIIKDRKDWPFKNEVQIESILNSMQ